MLPNGTGQQVEKIAGRDRVGKLFRVVGDRRQCLVCEQLFARGTTAEHSQVVCYPPASNAN